ncbi:alpha/beta fold hydrolase [Antrihabitans sp. NCIMB 15449]|jgi:3-oxoadipate enol-lactonase|uniref:Alpha/beta fold hydrolase n=1 Tax=Antrihabitans spumae TaxID=3373370 RepID=A0ABW7JUY9_9NOCA
MASIDVNGTTLAYDEAGPKDATAIVFSHSLFFNRAMFDYYLQNFSPQYRVVTYDHRGQGESASAPLDELDMDTLTDDAAALIEALDLGPCHFVGNSMGGFVALRLAARRPDLLRSAVALNSSAEEEHKLAEFEPVVAAARDKGPAELIDILMYIMFGDTSIAEETPAAKHWRLHMLSLPNSIADSAHQVIHRRSIVDELASTKVPVLAIAGSEDHAYPPPISSENIAAATGGRHLTVEAAGHSVSAEQPEIVAGHLRDHFARVDG